jgi:hypothetical protein
MDSLSHLLFVILLVTPLGLAPYRLTLKIVLFSAVVAGLAYAAFGITANFIYVSEVVAHLVILYLLYLILIRKKPFLKLFMASLAAVVIAGFSHWADQILIWVDRCPPMTSALRPHNFWHAPLFALALSAAVVLVTPPILNLLSRGISRMSKIKPIWIKPKLVPLLAVTYFGYLTHIFTDSLTYDFNVWWLFPFSNVNFSLFDLANEGVRFLPPSPANPWGWWYYYLTPALVIAAFVFFALCYFIKKK